MKKKGKEMKIYEYEEIAITKEIERRIKRRQRKKKKREILGIRK